MMLWTIILLNGLTSWSIILGTLIGIYVVYGEDNKDNTITIEFLKDKMSSDEQLKFLNSISLSNVNNTESKVLSIEEELTITNLLNGNSKEQSFILKRGNFPLLDNPNKYILTLNIKE